MFYKLIIKKCNEWIDSDSCAVKNIIEYIKKTNKMRDAQIEAIKIYLFLKIECGGKSLEDLFVDGEFNSINVDDLEVNSTTRNFLNTHPEAIALFEYACLKNEKGEQVSKNLEQQIKSDPSSIDYKKFFKDVFYNTSYTEYLFSLPMGAGKTYLMAAFIYLDLYFAQNEPDNPAFAHNFIILAPSGLKSSVVPSLRTIQKFDTSWILPEPAASEVKKLVSFEVLDQAKTANKSNKAKNPNVQKIANHQPLSELFGLVAVTNAEKVILDRLKEDVLEIVERTEDEKDNQANELRNLIGKLPSLSVFIDEVHHAVKDEIKLRGVVNKWAENGMINSVIGFSGTPYIESPEKIQLTDNLSVSSNEITNIVYYYPLIDGVGNFLKRPLVVIEETAESTKIIERGVRKFFDTYKDTVYEGGLTAKLGIYCGTIEKLEEIVYPIVSKIVVEYGFDTNVILKFHKGNKQYQQPSDGQLEFDTLDMPFSKIRIVLLVQIGKEGWDCRSLTGIILSQEGDCPNNMVLQTSCRCLRQVVRNAPETAIICLNKSNADKLNAQLMQQHHISLNEFQNANKEKTVLHRYNRTEYLKLPKLDYYQFAISYDTLIAEPANVKAGIEASAINAKNNGDIYKTTDLQMQSISREVIDTEIGNEQITFDLWIAQIIKGGFGCYSFDQLKPHYELLKKVFDEITYTTEDGVTCFSSKYSHTDVESNIRKAFCDKRDFVTRQENIPAEAALLNIRNFTPEVHTDNVSAYYPEQTMVEKIIKDDRGELKLDENTENAIRALEAAGQTDMAATLRAQTASHPQKDRSFHYLPYRTDSNFEQIFMAEILSLSEIKKLGLEVYYNGDDTLTEFKIKCYKTNSSKWTYVGIYTPDFLIIQRRDGKIHKAIIVETKGEIYSHNPTFKDKRTFMETEFIKRNNAAFGYDRFEYLYLEDTLSEKDRILLTHKTIKDFFEER